MGPKRKHAPSPRKSARLASVSKRDKELPTYSEEQEDFDSTSNSDLSSGSESCDERPTRRRKSRTRSMLPKPLPGGGYTVRVNQKDINECKKQGLEPPTYYLKITQEQHDKARSFLDAPMDPDPDYGCSYRTFCGAEYGSRSYNYDHVMSDWTMQSEMLSCLDSGDLDGFMETAIGASRTRTLLAMCTNYVLAALYALFYHPAAKNEEDFQRCLVGLFSNYRKGGSTRTVDQILRTIFSAFEFE